MSDVRVILKDVRLSYPNLFRPGDDNVNDKGETVPGKYSAVAILDPSDANHKKVIKNLEAAILEVAKEKWGDNIPKTVLPKKSMCCLRDGDDKNGDEFTGMLTVSASNKVKPPVCGRKRTQVIEESDGIVYAGCYVNMVVSLWCMDNSFGKRVCANLSAVQYVRDGEPFGSGAIDVEDVFDDLDDDLDEEITDLDDEGYEI